jgi:uncharacterized protein YecE (DUF72 family)
MESGRARIGCSGWQYAHWRGDFYPEDLPAARWLEHYASRFDTVEVNNTFYRLPEAPVFASWRRRVPPGFCFALKASGYLTHRKRLRDPREPLQRFFSRARRLGDRLGPVLYQLPPRWRKDVERLRSFLARLPRRRPQAVEFRDPSWYAEDVYDALEESGVALCLHDHPGSASPAVSVGPFVYRRFHGPGLQYGGRYSDGALARAAEGLSREIDAGRDVYVYFNNDQGGHAPRDAQRLAGLIVRG